MGGYVDAEPRDDRLHGSPGHDMGRLPDAERVRLRPESNGSVWRPGGIHVIRASPSVPQRLDL